MNIVQPELPGAANGETHEDVRADADMEVETAQAVPSKTTLPPSLAFLTPEELAPPKMPTKAEMEIVLLDLRKRALLEEYLGKEQPSV